jgi:hypothetical protein
MKVDPDRNRGRAERQSPARFPSLNQRSPQTGADKMKSEWFALAFVTIGSTAVAASADPDKQIMDVSMVTMIKVTGDASSINLTTTETSPYAATIDGRRTGWFARWYSSWFFDDCRTSSRMRIDGATLVVDVAASSWLDVSDCTAEIKANVRKETAVSIQQAASQVKLAGDFSSIALDNKAADITLDGHAGSIMIAGDAIKAHLAFDKVQQNEIVELNAKALDVYLGFGKDTPISYSIEATASMVDSALANEPNAKPAISITGEFVRATIR